MVWTDSDVDGYHTFAKTYIENFGNKIDCADLALAALVDYAAAHSLPVRLRYYKDGAWAWYELAAGSRDASKFKTKVMTMLGALNVIDNTKAIPTATAKPGDLIMSKWSGSSGHTRIIHGLKYDAKAKDYQVTWYQGNLPIVVPEKKSGPFSQIAGVYEDKPRRWKFSQFGQ